ncbi:MAG: hypothetical protein PHV55_04460, partial [Candidatus Omnitrophica bacterium]|nr:hypothetical protein [Candidatus Omnitrophota bacterium]
MNIKPSLNDFKKLARKNNLIVLSCKFYSDWLTPLSIYYGLSQEIKGESFLLESVEGEEKVSRFSFLGFNPLCTFKSKGKTIYVTRQKTETFDTRHDPLYELRNVMKRFTVAPREHLRFFGGFVGYIGYDTVRFYEPIGKEVPDSLNTFDTYLMLPKFLIVFDHLHRQIEILSFCLITSPHNPAKQYLKESAIIKKLFDKISTPHQLSELEFSAAAVRMQSNFKKNDFCARVRKAKEYIKQGEI